MTYADAGFKPFMPEKLFPFQAALVEWAVRKGRAALFADCGRACMIACNSMVVSDAKFDAHHAHRCVECAAMFGRMNPVAEETSDGDLCADCAAEHEMRKDDE